MPVTVWRFDRLSSLRVYSHHERVTPSAEALVLGQHSPLLLHTLVTCMALGLEKQA